MTTTVVGTRKSKLGLSNVLPKFYLYNLETVIIKCIFTIDLRTTNLLDVF